MRTLQKNGGTGRMTKIGNSFQHWCLFSSLLSCFYVVNASCLALSTPRVQCQPAPTVCYLSLRPLAGRMPLFLDQPCYIYTLRCLYIMQRTYKTMHLSLWSPRPCNSHACSFIHSSSLDFLFLLQVNESKRDRDSGRNEQWLETRGKNEDDVAAFLMRCLSSLQKINAMKFDVHILLPYFRFLVAEKSLDVSIADQLIKPQLIIRSTTSFVSSGNWFLYYSTPLNVVNTNTENCQRSNSQKYVYHHDTRNVVFSFSFTRQLACVVLSNPLE